MSKASSLPHRDVSDDLGVDRRRPIRVAYLLGSLDLGGSERQLTELALRLPRDSFNVEFLLLTHRGPLAAQLEASGVPVQVLGWKRPARLRDIRPLDWLRLALVLRAGRYDIVDAWLFHAYGIAALTRPITRVPVLVMGRRSLFDSKAGHGRGYRMADAVARRSANAIVANSPQVREDVIAHERVDPDRVRVIRNGVGIPAPMTPEMRTALRAGWGFRDGDVVVGCVANYKPRKGIESLVRVMAALTTQAPTLRLVLVGDGPLRDVLVQMISEHGLAGTVRLHGHEPDARGLYGAFDIVALASESEGLPNVLLEAAAAGRPIVATAAGGSADVVVEGETGLLVPVRDEAAFSRALARLAGNATLRDSLGLAARRRAETVFGMDRFVAETTALYQELASGTGVAKR